MIVSLNWLKEYIELSGISTEELVEKLTTSGSEIEAVIDKSSELKNIVVGYVESVEKHPNADKLSLCKVSDGNNIYNVVCGAPNVAAGQKVPFAKIGAVIPNGKFEIKKAKIRGEKSEGMICAEDELGLGSDHSGIMVLDETARLGQELSEHLKLNDILLDISITPNRADSLSHVGIARDVAALFNRKIKYPKVNTEYKTVKENNYAKVFIENAEGCPRYSAVTVKDITVKESPEWLKEKLLSIELRPINNIVDVTNFILHEIGQPLHAFDLSLLSGNTIVVKNNNGRDEFTTLDSKKRSMLPNDLMICDSEKPVAVAGVMGGENSEVTSGTKDILIESAYFNPSYVRKTAKHLGLSTDSSYRFERGTDPNNTLFAALRAAELIKEVAGGKICSDVIDVYPKKYENKKVSVRYKRITKILGFEISKDNVKQILESLEFKIINSDDEKIEVEIPTFRHDIEREIDLIEEVVRIYGFDGIPSIEKITLALTKKVDETEFEDRKRELLTSLNFNEVVSNSLLSKEKTMTNGSSIKVLNPQSKEMSHLRTSLIPGMLLNISRNIKVKQDNIRFFEIGNVFTQNSREIKSFDDFSENQNLIFAICGNRNESAWYQKEKNYDIYDLIGVTNKIFEKLKVKDKISLSNDEIFKYSISKIISNNEIAKGGAVNKKILELFDISKDVYLFEINLTMLKKLENEENKYEQLLKYPKVYRDFSFILDKNINYIEVVKTIKQSSSKLLKNINLFDIFESESLGSNKKSLAFQLEYFDEKRTLQEDEIDSEFWKTIEAVKSNLKAELRG
ncbi:MAG: phenylalanine--tRNA ligase subunit beta [Ignavibacteriae bacterium]|nr:MAG: phenylalanine--tRNA ligase subunit beta [Ignavibacteriota bacterium]